MSRPCSYSRSSPSPTETHTDHSAPFKNRSLQTLSHLCSLKVSHTETKHKATEHVLQECPTFTDLRTSTWPQRMDMRRKLWGCSDDLERTMDLSWRPGFLFSMIRQVNRDKKEDAIVTQCVTQCDILCDTQCDTQCDTHCAWYHLHRICLQFSSRQTFLTSSATASYSFSVAAFYSNSNTGNYKNSVTTVFASKANKEKTDSAQQDYRHCSLVMFPTNYYSLNWGNIDGELIHLI